MAPRHSVSRPACRRPSILSMLASSRRCCSRMVSEGVIDGLHRRRYYKNSNGHAARWRDLSNCLRPDPDCPSIDRPTPKKKGTLATIPIRGTLANLGDAAAALPGRDSASRSGWWLNWTPPNSVHWPWAPGRSWTAPTTMSHSGLCRPYRPPSLHLRRPGRWWLSHHHWPGERVSELQRMADPRSVLPLPESQADPPTAIVDNVVEAVLLAVGQPDVGRWVSATTVPW
jgi:hypothetical protein